MGDAYASYLGSQDDYTNGTVAQGLSIQAADQKQDISQEDCWTVISSFFNDKGLVRQQLDSFDEFVQNTMQEIVDENRRLVLQTTQGVGSEGDQARRYYIHFGQVYLSKPTMTEADGSVQAMFPQEARLRNLTYAAPLYVDMKKKTSSADTKAPENRDKSNVNEMFDEGELDDEEDDSGPIDPADFDKVFVGKVPIMLRSAFCVLNGLSDKELYSLNECPYDQVQ
ncbi:hypothetical protein G9A89_018665 [Geosiphon pyriformis]|nr:hypothetical protein G9A89_018665 [Geosiphon pyriformis]